MMGNTFTHSVKAAEVWDSVPSARISTATHLHRKRHNLPYHKKIYANSVKKKKTSDLLKKFGLAQFTVFNIIGHCSSLLILIVVMTHTQIHTHSLNSIVIWFFVLHNAKRTAYLISLLLVLPFRFLK